MAKFDLSGIPSRRSGMEVSSFNGTVGQPLSAPLSTKLSRRISNLDRFLRSNSDSGSSNNIIDHHMRRNSVAWQTMSQHLTLQLQQWRQSQSAARRRRCRPKLAPEEHKEHIIELIDEVEEDSKIRRSPIEDQFVYHSGLEVEELNIEEKSFLKSDVHIVTLEKLAERFSCHLTCGLTNEMIHVTFLIAQNAFLPRFNRVWNAIHELHLHASKMKHLMHLDAVLRCVQVRS